MYDDRPRREEFLVFGSPDIRQDEIDEVVATLKSGWIGTGPKTKQFEAMFASYTRAGSALALNSCTAGLDLALDVIELHEGEEVITTPMTFVATANVIEHHRARPVFVDVDARTMNIDPALIEQAITERTRAILAVDMAGRPCDYDAISDIARRHNLVLIEDAAHATEAWYQGRKVGSIADLTAFSFYVTKNLVTGEGGMLTTSHREWMDELRIRSLHGISKDAWKRYSASGFTPYECTYPGYKYNMTDVQASLGLHQLARIEESLKLREYYWAMYDAAFADVPELITPAPNAPGSRHARHLYTLLLDIEHLGISRNEFVDALKDENIGAGVHFTAVHLHPYYQQKYEYCQGDYPMAEWISERTVSLPLSTRLTEDDVQDVIAAVLRLVRRYSRRYNLRLSAV